MQAIILCGGLASRLGKIAEKTPKAMLFVGDRTVLDHQIKLLDSAKVTEVILASGHLHQIIFDCIGYEHKGIKITYAKEDKRLGTGGAIKNAMKHISSDAPFFVLNGDILTQGLDLGDMLIHHRTIEKNLEQRPDGILLSTLVDDVRDFGEIISDPNGKTVSFKEKEGHSRSGYINVGLYLLNKSIENYFPPKDVFSIERDVFPNVDELYSFQVEIDMIDVGVPERLDYARSRYSA